MSCTYVSNTARVKNNLTNGINLTLRLMIEDIHRQANPITPKKDGHLRTAVTKSIIQNNVAEIAWLAPYAEYQERGYTSGPVVHYTTPGTHAGFAEESVKKVVANLPTYARKAGLL